MNETNFNDEILFDRLVDGELSSQQRRQLLASLDDRPGGWRRCALAFLEAQSWRTDVGQIAREAIVASPQPQSASQASVEHRFARPRAMLGWLAVAASLLAAFGLGSVWHGSRIHLPSQPRESQVAVDNTPTGEAATSPGTRASKDALTFWVRDGAGGAQSVNVPLVDASTVDRQFGVTFRSGVPDAVRDHLERNGYNVESTRRYAPLYLEDGRSLVVPVEDTHIVPISPVVY